MIHALPLLVAHEGGWDETVFAVAPVGVFAVMVLLARRRAGALEDHDEDGDAATDAETPRP